MNTTQDQRDQWLPRVFEGKLPGLGDIAHLIADANEAEILEAKIEGIEAAMLSVGYVLVDVSTDDEAAFDIVRVEE